MKIYVAEYNPIQKEFHVEWKSEKRRKVLEAIIRKDWESESQWMTFFEGTVEECHNACNFLRNKLN